jgi:hypothetical protein
MSVLKLRKALQLIHVHLLISPSVTIKVTALLDAGRGWNCLRGDIKSSRKQIIPVMYYDTSWGSSVGMVSDYKLDD